MKEILIGAGAALAIFLTAIGINMLPVVFIMGGLYFIKILGDGRLGYRGVNALETGAGAVESPGVTFSDIGGQEMAKRELKEALDFLKDLPRSRKLGIRPIKGILLTGPPGTGKTLLAKAAANYTDAVFLATSGSEFVEMYAGVGAQRVRQLFARAREKARKCGKPKAIIFIDEIEVLGGKRGRYSSHLEYDQTLNQLLVEMDGLHSRSDVLILMVAATNRADLLDPALLRPGRFDRQVAVDLPDEDGRCKILQIHSKDKPLAEDIEIKQLAKETWGFSGAQLESVTNEAAILAMRRGKERISMDEFREAVDKVMLGEKLERRPGDEALARIAVHEMGHAVISEVLRPGSVTSITISPRSNALGYIRQAPKEDMYLYTCEYLKDQIAVFLGGAGAEEDFFGSRSTGSANDLEQAVNLAKKMILAGLSELGVVSENDLPAHLMHKTLHKIIETEEIRAKSVLARYRKIIAAGKARLLADEKLDGGRFREMLSNQQ
ncbi:MAG: AAA family ATPase [Bacillota bacterium]